MRVERVLTNETCNQNCGFCSFRRPADAPEFVSRASVLRRIAARSAEDIVLTGGEPTLRRDLPSLVGAAKRRVRRVILETNAALVDQGLADGLARAGLDLARVHMPCWGDALDDITRDPGGFDATLRGMRALAAAGVALEVAVPIVRDNLELVADLPGQLASTGLAIEALVVGVPWQAPEASLLASVTEATEAIERLALAARRHGLHVRFNVDARLPPCLFRQPTRVAHLYTLTPGGRERADHVRVSACSRCEVADRCPGMPREILAREPGLAPIAIGDEAVRRRLSIIASVPEQIERELVTREVCRLDTGETVPMHTVRVNFHCNQSCHFCFVSTHLPPAEDSRIRAAILEAGRAGAVLALSGGEPTLNASLADYVCHGKQSGVRQVELQTNAIRLSDPELCRKLAEVGVDVAFVSLHGSRAEISDHVTNAPGTFEKTVRGIDQLVIAGIQLRLNFVFCGANYADFPDYVRMVAARWPNSTVTVSFVAPSTDMVPRDAALIPRYGAVLSCMVEGIARARAAGLAVRGFESMCSLPMCLVPSELEGYLGLAALPAGSGGGEFLKVEACRTCALEPRCWGIRKGYAELHGISELRPVLRT